MILEPAQVEPDDITLLALKDWLLTEGRESRDISHVIARLGVRLNEAGIPVDRMQFGGQVLHSEHVAHSSTWIKGQETLQQLQTYGQEAIDAYLSSPMREVHEERKSLFLWLRDIPDERYSGIVELKADGYTHLLCFPVFFVNGHSNVISLATRNDDGFAARHIGVLRKIMPALIAVIEIFSIYKSMDDVLRIYVGNDPHHAILAGDIGRGQVTRIRSAILFADMRSYTRITSRLEPEDVVALLNRYFDCLVPPIEAQGGEVLKYMGDGLLAIFRDRGDDTGAAAQSALAAASEALIRIEKAEADFIVPIRAGIALHHGEAAYGNVGSGERLDFTVVGRDVNLTSRLAQLNKVLGEPLLMSSQFARHMDSQMNCLGAFRLDGFDGEVEVYRP
ncbi:adenylate/guanylate cyclase domain-containing protein [Pseudochelatococcus contaminans]|uniref:adenylate/guanylate cyclase domain-containing protein n=1 Tax=Pseudochelatococcus contaminans TaxID=1538103 RepID=UPI001619F520|nr:adenylate/guanylate cyclase domain-containing protein [Pseudochelatococcus contaminans]